MSKNNSDENHQQHDDHAADAGAESQEEGAVAMAAAEDAVIGDSDESDR